MYLASESNVTIYKNRDCTIAYADGKAINESVGNFFIKLSDNVNSSATYDFTVEYDGNGNIDFTVVK